MGYLAFALKYRPSNFEEVVAQEHVVSALRNAILTNRIHHAYLFSGPRGVGKTSMARIFAKSLNCVKGPTVTPCGVCLSCSQITKGTSLDVIEIDGASNRGIDEIRALRENIKLSPNYSRYKIYIIDEVHMLTQEAFNALLKTLEEPPSHVKFIFATTHPQKVLPTILSRCQKFQFTLIPLEKIVDKLRKIVEEEKIPLQEQYLYAIARCSGGSVRDAESLLDQLAPIFLEKGLIKDIFSFLGIIDEESLNKMVGYIVKKDIKAILDYISTLLSEGKDLEIFLNSLIEHIRNLLLAKVSKDTFQEMVEISPYTKQFLNKQATLLSSSEILKIIDLLIEAKDLSRKLNSVRIPLELAFIKFWTSYGEKPASLEVRSDTSPKTQKVNEQEIKEKETMVDKKKTSGTDNQLIIDEDDDFLDDVMEDVEEDVLFEQKGFSEEKDTSVESKDNNIYLLEKVKAKWKDIISQMTKKRVSLASYLSKAFPYSLERGTLKIAFPPRYTFYKEIVEGVKNATFINGIIANVIGERLRVKFILLEDKGDKQAHREQEKIKEAKEEKTSEIQQQPEVSEEVDFVNELLDTFKGELSHGE